MSSTFFFKYSDAYDHIQTNITSLNHINYHLTVTLKPYLYNDTFYNQFTKVKSELGNVLNRLTTKAYIALESTLSGNLHFHILLNSTEPVVHIIDSFKGNKYFGNTVVKVMLTLSQLDNCKEYLLKEYDKTDKLMSWGVNTKHSPFYVWVAKPPKVYKKVKQTVKNITTYSKLDTLDNEFEDMVLNNKPFKK